MLETRFSAEANHLASTVAHTTHEHVDKPVGVQEHTIDLAGPFWTSTSLQTRHLAIPLR